MIRIPLATLRSAALHKPRGYHEACLRAGTVHGDHLELSEQAFAQLRARFSMPGRGTQIRTFVGAMAVECGAVLSGDPAVDAAEKARRLEVCEHCEWFVVADRRCSRCGCWMDAKAGLRSARCPLERW